MAEEQNTHDAEAAFNEANMRDQPIGREEPRKALAEPTAADADVDHLEEIRQIAVVLPNASPEGATTASQKILLHLEAFKNPDAFNERLKAEQDSENDAEEVRAKRRAALKQPVPEADKEASEAVAA